VFDEPVRAVLLDAGGVLLVPDADALRRALAPLGATPSDESCLRAHYLGTHEIDQAAALDWRIADRAIARALGVPDERIEDAIDAIESVYLGDAWRPAPGATHALLALQLVGMPLAVVSNASGTMEHQLLTHRICAVDGGGEVAEVAIVVDSHVVGNEKPDPRIFDIALDALRIEPAGAIYVGDTVRFDVVGARAAGLTPVHVDPYDFCSDDDHAHARSLAELVDPIVSARA
jgi:putative hydrolase of the HAD superfamily